MAAGLWLWVVFSIGEVNILDNTAPRVCLVNTLWPLLKRRTGKNAMFNFYISWYLREQWQPECWVGAWICFKQFLLPSSPGECGDWSIYRVQYLSYVTLTLRHCKSNKRPLSLLLRYILFNCTQIGGVTNDRDQIIVEDRCSSVRGNSPNRSIESSCVVRECNSNLAIYR